MTLLFTFIFFYSLNIRFIIAISIKKYYQSLIVNFRFFLTIDSPGLIVLLIVFPSGKNKVISPQKKVPIYTAVTVEKPKELKLKKALPVTFPLDLSLVIVLITKWLIW